MYDVVQKPSEVNQGASADTAKQHSSVSKAHAADIVNKVDKGDKSSADAKKRKEPAPEEVKNAAEELTRRSIHLTSSDSSRLRTKVMTLWLKSSTRKKMKS